MQSYGLHDFLKQESLERVSTSEQKRPLSSVAMYAGEDYASTSRLYKVMHDFADFKVADLFSVSLIEFLNFPVEEAEFMLRYARKSSERKLNADSAAIDRIERQIEGKK